MLHSWLNQVPAQSAFSEGLAFTWLIFPSPPWDLQTCQTWLKSASGLVWDKTALQIFRQGSDLSICAPENAMCHRNTFQKPYFHSHKGRKPVWECWRLFILLVTVSLTSPPCRRWRKGTPKAGWINPIVFADPGHINELLATHGICIQAAMLATGWNATETAMEKELTLINMKKCCCRDS